MLKARRRNANSCRKQATYRQEETSGIDSFIARIFTVENYSVFLFWLDFSTGIKCLEYLSDNYPETLFVTSRAPKLYFHYNRSRFFEPSNMKIGWEVWSVGLWKGRLINLEKFYFSYAPSGPSWQNPAEHNSHFEDVMTLSKLQTCTLIGEV